MKLEMVRSKALAIGRPRFRGDSCWRRTRRASNGLCERLNVGATTLRGARCALPAVAQPVERGRCGQLSTKSRAHPCRNTGDSTAHGHEQALVQVGGVVHEPLRGK